MKYVILSICLLLAYGCQSNNNLPKEIRDKYDNASGIADDCVDLLNKYAETKDIKEYLLMYKSVPSLAFDYKGVDLTEQQYDKCRAKKLQIDSIHRVISKVLKDDLKQHKKAIAKVTDRLVNASLSIPFHAKRGTNLSLTASADNSFTIKLYNADSRKQIYNSGLKNDVQKEIKITNSAVYLLELVSKSPIYVDLSLLKDVEKIEDFFEVKEVSVDTIPSSRGEFRAQKVDGVKMKNLFQEPRKITLRSQTKSFFSGSSRSIVALNLPTGATDVMYSLRISTSDSDRGDDGEFFDRTYKRYHEIRFLGLPVYESTRTGNSLIRELLSISEPPREEEAYCSMYVFKSAADARQFQNEKPINTLKYNLDYSIVGTQSCNGCIPVKGLKTLYLGFENEKMTSSVYLWLEAISAVKATEYFKEKYVVTTKQF